MPLNRITMLRGLRPESIASLLGQPAVGTITRHRILHGFGVRHPLSRLRHSFQRNETLLGPTVRRKTSSSSNADKEGSASLLSVCLAWYAMKLDTHPITTKCISSGLISGTGDMICQYLTLPNNDGDNNNNQSHTARSWDMTRTIRFASLGAFWVGPVLHFWYGSLIHMSKKVWLRVTLDQFAFAPTFVTSFLAWIWLWEGEQPATLPSRLKQNVPSIVVANWALWIPAQAVNFTLVPVKYHVLFSNFVALIWNAYLSYSSHNSKSITTDEKSGDEGERSS